MKKILALFLCLLPAIVLADVDTFEGEDSTDTWEGVSTTDTREGQTAAGGVCTTPDNGDEIDEGFGSTADNTWTSTTRFGTSLPGSPPASCCSTGFYSDTDDTEDVTRWDRGSAIGYANDIDIVCEIYVDAVSIDENTSVSIINLGPNTAGDYSENGRVQINNASGSYYLRGDGDGYSSGISLTLDTWLTVTLHLDATAADSYIDVEGSSESFSRNDQDGRYLHVGTVSGIGAGETADIYFGYCYVNTP
jgi:hypothetical protein